MYVTCPSFVVDRIPLPPDAKLAPWLRSSDVDGSKNGGIIGSLAYSAAYNSNCMKIKLNQIKQPTPPLGPR